MSQLFEKHREATHAVLLINTTLLYEGSDFRKCLATVDGFDIAFDARDGYKQLVSQLEALFGEPEFFSSWYPGAVETINAIFGLMELNCIDLLDPEFRFETYQGGEWLQRQHPKALNYLVQQILKESDANENLALLRDAASLKTFIYQIEHSFRVAATFEPFISLGLRGFLKTEELGLYPCYGALVQIGNGQILCAESVSLAPKKPIAIAKTA